MPVPTTNADGKPAIEFTEGSKIHLRHTRLGSPPRRVDRRRGRRDAGFLLPSEKRSRIHS